MDEHSGLNRANVIGHIKTFNANTNFELSNIEYKSGIYFYYIEAQDKSINFLGNFISTK